MRLRRELHRRGLRYRKHQVPLPGLRCRADLIFRRERVAVFIDGCFWHGCPQHGKSPQTNSDYWSAKIEANVERDKRNNDLLAGAGWKVVRVWEHEDPTRAADEIGRMVERIRLGAGA